MSSSGRQNICPEPYMPFGRAVTAMRWLCLMSQTAWESAAYQSVRYLFSSPVSFRKRGLGLILLASSCSSCISIASKSPVSVSRPRTLAEHPAQRVRHLSIDPRCHLQLVPTVVYRLCLAERRWFHNLDIENNYISVLWPNEKSKK